MADKTKKIDNNLKFKGNPRKITEKQQILLKQHLEELGDLSGVVYCVNNQAYVGGNQRSDIFHGCNIHYVKQYDEPTEQGTLSHGFIEYNGEEYAYREVSFTEEQFKQACIVANNDGGSFDWDILQSWDFEQLGEWGLESEFLGEGFVNEKDYSDKNKEIDVSDFSDKMELKLYFDSEAYQFVLAKLSENEGSKEYNLLEILGYEQS